jgi:hypothetical protein
VTVHQADEVEGLQAEKSGQRARDNSEQENGNVRNGHSVTRRLGQSFF